MDLTGPAVDWDIRKFDEDSADLSDYGRLHLYLRGVLTPAGAARWMDTPMAKLDGRTPKAVIAAGRMDLVLDVARGYLDTSFT